MKLKEMQYTKKNKKFMSDWFTDWMNQRGKCHRPHTIPISNEVRAKENSFQGEAINKHVSQLLLDRRPVSFLLIKKVLHYLHLILSYELLSWKILWIYTKFVILPCINFSYTFALSIHITKCFSLIAKHESDTLNGENRDLVRVRISKPGFNRGVKEINNVNGHTKASGEFNMRLDLIM